MLSYKTAREGTQFYSYYYIIGNANKCFYSYYCIIDMLQ